MSFGYSVGDFVAIGNLTWTIYRACKDAPGEFQELARELGTLHTILHELEDEAKRPTSLLNRRGSSRKAELDTLLRNSSNVLKQIEDIVDRYHSLGRDQRRTWDRVKFATEDLVALRTKLSFHINGINLFISGLSAGSLARIEMVLEELVKDIKHGKKETTVISTCEQNDELAWSELERGLVGDGIMKHDVERYKVEIKLYLMKLVQESIPAVGCDLNVGLINSQPGDGIPRHESVDSIPAAPGHAPQSWKSRLSGMTNTNRLVLDTVIQEYVSGGAEYSGHARNQVKRRAGREIIVEADVEFDDGVQIGSALDVKHTGVKGIFDLSNPSTRSVQSIRSELIRVLQCFDLDVSEIPGGFVCRYTQPASVYSISREQLLAFAPKVIAAGGNLAERFRQTASFRERNSLVDFYGGPRHSDRRGLTFEILVVKIPLLPLHGIKFNLPLPIEHTSWYYCLCSWILENLNV
jgi:hypothetical protein